MAGLTRLFWRFFQFCALAFVATSVLYTTTIIFISPLASVLSRSFRSSSLLGLSVADVGHASARGLDQTKRKPSYPISSESKLELADRASVAPTFGWASSDFVLQHGLGHPGFMTVDEKTLLSKAFANSMRPSNVTPYFYRSTGSFDKDHITITTLITSNRFEVFARLVEKYQGPISVTVHIKDVAEHVQEVLESLHEMYISSPAMQTYVDVHLVVDAFDRQFNTWRNIARLFAQTDFVMMLDIDFYPCTDLRSIVKQSSSILGELYAGRAALVIPAFEYVDFHQGANHENFPSNKTGLLSLVNEKRLDVFHASWGPGHNSTEYKRFYAASAGELYKVTRYQSAYEPYVIFKKDGPPWCDERFVGYGGNKAACLFEMFLAGVSYYVLADHFIIHQNHLYEETARKNERKYNRKIYADFKEEACLRYLKRYHDQGKLGSVYAENALQECRKIKSVVRAGKKYFTV